MFRYLSEKQEERQKISSSEEKMIKLLCLLSENRYFSPGLDNKYALYKLFELQKNYEVFQQALMIVISGCEYLFPETVEDEEVVTTRWSGVTTEVPLWAAQALDSISYLSQDGEDEE